MSIHPHSQADTYFLFCVGQSPIVINAFRSSMVHEGVVAKPLLGCYKGASEYSFIANMKDYNPISPWLREEESILYIHSFDARDVPKATLIFLKDGRSEDIGRMVPVSREEALRHDSWTYDPIYGNYFICR